MRNVHSELLRDCPAAVGCGQPLPHVKPAASNNDELMKAVLDNIVFALQQVGGISVVWRNLLDGIVKEADMDRTFLEYPNSNILRNEITLPKNEVSWDSLGLLNHKRYINPSCKDIGEDFIFHSSYYRICSNPLARNITTVHDFIYDYFTHGVRKAVHCHQKKHAILHSDAIVCVSENTRRDLLRLIPEADAGRIHVIHNGVSRCFKLLNDARNGLEDYIMFVGSRSGHKNFRFAVEAICQTRFGLIICGNALSASEKAYLDKTLGPGRYIVKVRPSNTELNELYNSVYCLVYPSYYEGFGLPVLEAQKAGCPVIAYNNSSIPEIIGDKALLMDSLSIDEFNDKIAILKTDSIRTEIIKAGLENAEKYSTVRMCREYIDIYRLLMNQ